MLRHVLNLVDATERVPPKNHERYVVRRSVNRLFFVSHNRSRTS